MFAVKVASLNNHSRSDLVKQPESLLFIEIHRHRRWSIYSHGCVEHQHSCQSLWLHEGLKANAVCLICPKPSHNYFLLNLQKTVKVGGREGHQGPSVHKLKNLLLLQITSQSEFTLAMQQLSHVISQKMNLLCSFSVEFNRHKSTVHGCRHFRLVSSRFCQAYNWSPCETIHSRGVL